MKKKYISHANLPPQFPWGIPVTWLFLDRFDAPYWAYVGFWVSTAIVISAGLIRFLTEEKVDLNQ